MILSICIPTYRREELLEAALKCWAPEIASCPGKVELLVGDNGASDQARTLVEDMGMAGQARYIRHPDNGFFNGNVLRLARDHARGKYLWVCGDDDFVHRGALAKIVRTLEAHPELDYFYVNTRIIRPHFATLDALRNAEHSPHAELENRDMADRLMAAAADIVPLAPGCFTGIYMSIWKREEVVAAFTDRTLAAFADLEGTLPHACHIARHLLWRPCYYFGAPLLTASHAVSYSDYGSLFRLYWLNLFYGLLEACGVPRRDLDPHRRKLIPPSLRQVFAVRRLRKDRMRTGGNFSLRWYIRANWRFPEFYGMILTTLGGRKLVRFFRRQERA